MFTRRYQSRENTTRVLGVFSTISNMHRHCARTSGYKFGIEFCYWESNWRMSVTHSWLAPPRMGILHAEGVLTYPNSSVFLMRKQTAFVSSSLGLPKTKLDFSLANKIRPSSSIFFHLRIRFQLPQVTPHFAVPSHSRPI